jgi:predicted amidohydrolase YtcJ
MTTVFTNANFVSLNEGNDIYSTMVVSGKDIVYVGFNTPICYDDARVVDLEGGYVFPLVNDLIYCDVKHAHCTILAEGQKADFVVLDRNVMNEKNPQILQAYRHGKRKI